MIYVYNKKIIYEYIYEKWIILNVILLSWKGNT